MSDVAVVILAAGSSSRLGRPKQTLLLAGEPLIAHVVRAARASLGDRVVAVVGAHRDEMESALNGMVDEIVFNPVAAEGQGTSIAAAVRYLDATAALLGEVGAVVFLLADQPGIDVRLIDTVINRWRAGARIVTTRYCDHNGHPVLFDRTWWRDLAALNGDVGGKAVIRAHPDAVETVIVDTPAPIDVDTEADWRMLQEMWQG